jgi:hypothetical protein
VSKTSAICFKQIGKKKRPLELIPATFVNIVAAHTGHSSQLFPVATGRNAQFLATARRSLLITMTHI